MEQLINNLRKINYENLNLDEVLTGRENTTFDGEWIRVFDEIKVLTARNKKNKIVKRIARLKDPAT